MTGGSTPPRGSAGVREKIADPWVIRTAVRRAGDKRGRSSNVSQHNTLARTSIAAGVRTTDSRCSACNDHHTTALTLNDADHRVTARTLSTGPLSVEPVLLGECTQRLGVSSVAAALSRDSGRDKAEAGAAAGSHGRAGGRRGERAGRHLAASRGKCSDRAWRLSVAG